MRPGTKEHDVRVLAIETSSATASLALLDDEQLVDDLELDSSIRTARALAPAMAAQLDRGGWRPVDVELVAVSTGPGSFTGLRVGVTTAKTFAYVVQAELVGINTLEVIAHQSTRPSSRVWAVLNALRGELFTAQFTRLPEGSWDFLQPTEVLPRETWLERLSEGDAVTGSGLSGLTKQLPPHIAVEPAANWTPRAVSVGRIALHHYLAGRRDDVWSLVPQYYRKSAAEEKRDQGKA
jgi:tRNA threonylcarbamoyladenosine biosynthesis protein TsaB